MDAFVGAQRLDRAVSKPASTVVQDKALVGKADKVSHFMEHNKRAKFAVGECEEGAASQKNTIARNFPIGIDFTLAKKPVGKCECDARIARRVGYKDLGTEGAEKGGHQKSIGVQIEDAKNITD